MAKKGFFKASELTSKKIKTTAKNAHCEKCKLHLTCRNPRMEPKGKGEIKVLHVGQAPGAIEDKKNEQLIGTAGKFYERCLKKVGMNLNDGLKTNACTCFLNPKTNVYTSHGYKRIIDVNVNDLVLTHKGKFKKVLSRTHDYNLYTNKYVKVTLSTDRGKFKTLCVTTDHRFRSEKDWKFASNLKKGDKIQVLGEKCAHCGKIYPINPLKFDDQNHVKVCSYACKNKIVKVDSEKKSRQMKKLYKKGIIDRNQVTKNANKKVRELSNQGKWTWFGERPNPNNQSIGRQSKINRISNNKNILGEGEIEFAEYLYKQEINFISQYAIGRYNYDFYLIDENILIEIDNPKRNHQTAVEKRKRTKNRVAKKYGYELIRLSSINPIKEFKRLNKNHKSEYCFCDVEVSEVEIINSNRNYRLYSLEIENDHSYIAMGVVNHNCYPPKDKKPTKTQLKACHPNLRKCIEEFKPHVIIALGECAIESLTMHKSSTSLIGGLSTCRGFVIPDKEYNAWICPTFHPSYVMRDTTPDVAEKIFLDDLKHAVKMIDVPLPYHIKDNEESKIEILKHPKETKLWLKKMMGFPEQKFMTAFDYETSGLKPQHKDHFIRTCSISLDPDHAVAFPFFNDDQEFLTIFSRYLAATDIMKIAANMQYENTWSNVKLEMNINGWLYDTMIGMHCIDNRPKICSLERMNYFLFGVEPYDEYISKFLKSEEGRGNSFNKIEEADLHDLLIYNGMDSMTEFKHAVVGMELNQVPYKEYYDINKNPTAQDIAPQLFVRR